MTLRNGRVPYLVIGALLLAAGVALFIFGMNASDSMADQWSEFFTGNFTDGTILYIVGGIAAVVVGLTLLLFGGRSSAGHA